MHGDKGIEIGALEVENERSNFVCDDAMLDESFDSGLKTFIDDSVDHVSEVDELELGAVRLFSF